MMLTGDDAADMQQSERHKPFEHALTSSCCSIAIVHIVHSKSRCLICKQQQDAEIWLTFHSGCAMLRIRALPKSFLPHSLSIVPTSKFAGRPPLTMLTGSHCGSCSQDHFGCSKTLICQSDATETHRLRTDLGVLDKKHKLYIFRIYSWSGWHLRSCSLAAHALPHALLAFAFSSAGLQKQRGMMREMCSFTHGVFSMCSCR